VKVRIGVSLGPAGLTKFVVRPAAADTPFGDFLERYAAELMPLQT
jgi:hypothetical protein